MGWRPACLAVMFASACGFAAPGASNPDGATQPDGDTTVGDAPVRDASHLIDGPSCASMHHTCVAPRQLEICADANGSEALEIECPWGCKTVGNDQGQCRVQTPAGGVLEQNEVIPANANDIVVGGEGHVWHVNTDTGEIKNDDVLVRMAGTGVLAGIEYRTKGPDAAIFRMRSLTATDEIRFFGKRTVSLVVSNDVVLHGPIVIGEGCEPEMLRVGGRAGGDHGQDGMNSEPAHMTGGKKGLATTLGRGGGGGGAGAFNGGPGGVAEGGIAAAGAGGTGYEDLEIAKLQGGGGGGGGAGGNGGRGGTGGGAFQILALGSITIDTGSINAGGCRGSGGTDGGGGGGAGGAILLDAPIMMLSGVLAVNGGGGGAGNGIAGESGKTSDDVALGGTCPGSTGIGGSGGAGGLPYGGFGAADDFDGGGGGGAVGRIRINVLDPALNGGQPTFTGTPTYSPAQGFGTVVGYARVD